MEVHRQEDGRWMARHSIELIGEERVYFKFKWTKLSNISSLFKAQLRLNELSESSNSHRQGRNYQEKTTFGQRTSNKVSKLLS